MQVTDILVDETKRELTVQSRSDFPLAVYYSVMSRNILGYTRLHWHPEFQLCLVKEGRICFFVNDTRFVLGPGEGIFINSEVLHLARPVGDPDSAYICLNIAPRLLSGFTGSLIEQRYILPLRSDASFEALHLCPDGNWQSRILELIEDIYLLREGEQKEQGTCSELQILALFYDMFSVIIRHRPPAQANARRNQANVCIQKIISYIDAHYSEHLTLQDISEATSYTTSECCRIFKRFTGESIFSYLRTYRLEKSISLLRDTHDSISDIAYACGFSSTSYYIEAFKKQFLTTPLQFRSKSL